MSNTDYLPLAAIPHFVKLLALYNKSLEELIEMFHEQQNEAAFAKLLDHLVNDFEYYQESYAHWQQQVKTTAESHGLKALKVLLEEAEQFIAEAVTLVKH